MSLTSYRTALPRVGSGHPTVVVGQPDVRQKMEDAGGITADNARPD